MRAYPYQRLPGVVSLRVDSVELRGPDDIRDPLDTSAFSVVEQVVAPGATGRHDWEWLRMKVSATVPGRATAPDSPWTDLTVVVVLSEGATNTRITTALTPGAEGGRQWVGQLDLWRADHLDRATMSVHVVATVDGVAGREIAASTKDWIVDLKAEAPCVTGNSMSSRSAFARAPSGCAASMRFPGPWTRPVTFPSCTSIRISRESPT